MSGTVRLHGFTLPLVQASSIEHFVGRPAVHGVGTGPDGFVTDTLARTHLVDSPASLANEHYSPARALDGTTLHGPGGRFPIAMNNGERQSYLYNVLRFSGPEMTAIPAHRAPQHDAIEAGLQRNDISLNMYGQARYYHAGATGIADDPEFYITTLAPSQRHLFPTAQWQ